METNGSGGPITDEWVMRHFDHLSPALAREFHPTLARARSLCPVARSDAYEAGFWVLTRYEDVLRVAQNWQTFSSELGITVPAPPTATKILPVTVDPPLQRAFKRLVNAHFTPAKIAPWEAPTRALVNQLIDGFIERGECDFMTEFARPFPGRAFFELALHAPADDLEQVNHWATQASLTHLAQSRDGLLKLAGWIAAFVEQRRADGPRGDVVDAVLTAEIEGRPITPQEIIGTIHLLILGGLETTAGVLGAAMLRFCAHPEIPALLRQRPELIPQAVEELLRLDGSFICIGRTARQDTHIDGHQVKEGERVIMYWASANRDETEFPAPDTFDLDRERNRHIAFGAGPHRCVGSNLARMNLRVAIDEIVRRLADVRLQPGAGIDFHSTFNRAPLSVPITFTPGLPVDRPLSSCHFYGMNSEVHYDPYNVNVNADPYPVYRRLREEAPLYYNGQHDFYALSRFDDVDHALSDPKTYLSGRGAILEMIKAGIEFPPGVLIFEDPPVHTTHRRLLSGVFTPRKVTALEPKIREFCVRCLDPLVGAGRFDFVADIGALVPMWTIGMLFGIPEEDQEFIRDRGNEHLHTEAGKPMEAKILSGEIFADYLDWRADHPSDDIMTDLLQAEFEDETGTRRRLTRDEILTYITVVVGAGNETTNRLIGWAGKVLADHPDQRGELAADPALIPGAIEELLRYEPPGTHIARYVARDVEWHGQTVPEGSAVLLLVASANRDDRRYPDGDRFDIHREFRLGLTFGRGIHYCLGAALARLEGRIALEEILKRFPDWAVDTEHARLAPTSTVRGWETLPVLTS